MTFNSKPTFDPEVPAFYPEQSQTGQLGGSHGSAILRFLLYSSLAGLAVLYALAFTQALLTRNWLLAGIESGLLLLAAAAAFLRKVNGRLRAISLLVVLYCAGLLALLLTPFSGLGQLLLLAGVFSAAILFSLPVALFYVVLGTVTLAGGGYALMVGILPLGSGATQGFRSLLFWPAAALYFLLAGLLITGLQDRLRRGWEHLFENLQRDKLEAEVERDALKESSADLERRLVQLHVVAEISRLSNSVDNPQALMEQAVTLIQERFDLYYAGIFLLDENREYAVLKAGSGQPGRQMVDSNHRLVVGGSSMVGWAVANAQARIALDTGSESIRFENPLLPHTRSELALPMRSGRQVFGALTIQSDQANAFDDNDLTVLQGLADAIAIAIQNAQRYQQVQAQLKEIEILNRQYLISAWSGHLQRGDTLEHRYQDEGASSTELPGEVFQSNLVIRDQVIGSLVIESGDSAWSEEEINLIEAVATQASQALENARLLKETQNKAYQEQLVSDFSTTIRESFNIDSILRTAVRELGDRLNLAEVEAHIGWNEDHPIDEA